MYIYIFIFKNVKTIMYIQYQQYIDFSLNIKSKQQNIPSQNCNSNEIVNN